MFFYMHGCKYCESTAPQVEALARQFAEYDLKVARFNVRENDLPHLQLRMEGVPSIWFFQRHDWTKPIELKMHRLTEEWATFINTYVKLYEKQDL
mmetsp:Transcript_67827/g.146252  ORF Transcript_67827/g.146252 Transcript_67827/m.146252 type:complete len:95 (-) Transcript_67827:113-397(-)